MPPVTFSKAFDLGKSQAELDFVDVPLNTDIPLFVDPFAISQRPERWSQQCHRTLVAFFQRIVDAIRAGRDQQALELLSHLQEPNETRLGLSKGRPAGAGIGRFQANQLYNALKDSSAVKTGFLSSLEECELMVEGIGWDKLSDLTTNIIRGHLLEYTKSQCELHGIPTTPVATAPHFDLATMQWVSRYADLPVHAESPIVLVPKVIARHQPAYEHPQYYRHFVLTYLQAEAIEASSSLVRTLKDGRRVVYKKDLSAKYPCTKEFLYEFSRDHPDVLARYREDLKILEKKGPAHVIGPDDESLIAAALSNVLSSIPAGGADASSYHKLMVGVVEFLFFPQLLYPTKEQEIHEGRKRIDIAMENGARAGIFYRLHDVRKLPCPYVFFECKNYVTEVANPELDQLSGRFGVNRGKFGFLCCRHFEDRELFVKRCRDTLNDDRGLIIPLDDKVVGRLLVLVEKHKRPEMEQVLSEMVAEIWM